MMAEKNQTPQPGLLTSFIKRKTPPSTGGSNEDSDQPKKNVSKKSKGDKSDITESEIVKDLEKDFDEDSECEHSIETGSIVQVFEDKMVSLFDIFKKELCDQHENNVDLKYTVESKGVSYIYVSGPILNSKIDLTDLDYG
jgi:hypothetical protein